MAPSANDLYLKAQRVGTEAIPYPAAGPEAVALLEQAIELEPGFARAWASLARARAKVLRSGDPGQPYADLRAKVIEAAETALSLDPTMGGAYLALADLEAFGDYARREVLVGKALAVAPDDPVVLTRVGVFAAEIGRGREAQACAGRAFELDPTHFWAAYTCAGILDFMGDSSSLPLWETFCDLWPDSEMVFAATYAAAMHGDWARFEAFSARARQVEGSARQERLRGYRWIGRNIRAPDVQSREYARQASRRDMERTGTISINWIITLDNFGLIEEAFELIEQASFSYMFDPRETSASGGASGGVIFSMSHTGRMIADRRFPRLCAKLGLCEYWVKADLWPDCADVVDYDFKGECRRLAA
jgi:tetratricopeptide (TPR) repeat protein